VHCDIKCENALVFKPEGSRADFWKVKLSDFGNSLVDVDYYSPEDIIDVEPIGTPLYIAPELQIPGHRRAKNLKAIDIWSWGLLLWEVVTSGARYTSTYNTSSVSIEDERTDLCTKGYKACENFIRQFHFHERGELGPGILEALRLSLDPDPSSRPSATTLLQRLGPLNGDL
jgi:serine/threonine protein kinase